MNYRKDKQGNDISILGYGCMRFTQSAGHVDMEKTEKEIMTAYDSGVNYYDTAYVYPGSEAALGEILAKNNFKNKPRAERSALGAKGAQKTNQIKKEAKTQTFQDFHFVAQTLDTLRLADTFHQSIMTVWE